MTKKDLIEVPKPKQIIKEDFRFGLFSRKYKKQFAEKLNTFEQDTKYSIEIDSLIRMLESFKEFCETHLEGQYTNIFVNLCSDYEYDDEIKFDFGSFSLGRLETDEEYNARITEENEYEKKVTSQRLRREAEQYLKLKKKFSPNMGEGEKDGR